jgi:cyclin D6
MDMATGAKEVVVVEAYEYEFDLENPFTSPADEPIASLLDAEGHHSPSVSAAASAARREAAGFISKVSGTRSPLGFVSLGGFFEVLSPVFLI